jgi:hypothetical protein
MVTAGNQKDDATDRDADRDVALTSGFLLLGG